jgi:hypothetical protein
LTAFHRLGVHIVKVSGLQMWYMRLKEMRGSNFSPMLLIAPPPSGSESAGAAGTDVKSPGDEKLAPGASALTESPCARCLLQAIGDVTDVMST